MKIEGQEITNEMEKLVKSIVKVALQYEKITGRKMGITGEVGEIRTCKELSLKLAPPFTKGYDAIGTDDSRYQIKTRRKSEEKKRRGKVPAFKNEDFDIAVLTILDENYEIGSICKLEKRELQPFFPKNKKKRISIRKFQRIYEDTIQSR